MAQEIKGDIAGNEVKIVMGDLTRAKVDALVAPEFAGGASFGGVGGAIARSGASAGLEKYDEIVNKKGEQKFGTVILTDSGGPGAPYLLHSVTVASGREKEFSTIQTAFYRALHTAQTAGLKSIASPALGTGIIGDLTDEQSAQAMMSAIQRYRQDGGRPISVEFYIYGDPRAFAAFQNVLSSQSYAASNPKQSGGREFDPFRWTAEMQNDFRANQKAFGEKGGIPPKPFVP